jgi:hypothetical protein
LCFERGPFFVQGSWGSYASLDQWSGNLKKFLLVVSDMGLPGFSVKHLDEVRALSSHEIVGIHSSVTTFYFSFLFTNCFDEAKLQKWLPLCHNVVAPCNIVSDWVLQEI